MAPEKSTIEQKQPTLPEKELSPEQKQEQEVLSMLESKYWVDLKLYIEEQSKVWISILKMDIQNPNQNQIEKKAKEVYESYLKNDISKPNWVEKVVNIENLVENTWNDKIKKLKEQFDKVLNPILDKYDFLDNQTKNFVKLWISNSLFKWTIWEISDSLIWSFWNFVDSLSKMDEVWIQKLASWAMNNPNETWRWAWLENLFKQKIWDLNNKLEQINDILNKVEPKLNNIEKQNIISHSNWFRSPIAIESWVENLKVSEIDTSKTNKNEVPLDNEKLTKYMLESRENIIKLSKKLELWTWVWDQLYAISSNPILWKYSDKIMETILKLPLIWKLIAILLWLDPENAIWEYRENTKNFKLLSSLKSLWKRKENWKEINWKEPFKETDLSLLNFNDNKSTLKLLSSTLWEIKDDKENNFWQKAFSEEWYWEKDPKFRLNLWDNNSDNKLTSVEFKKIVEEWVKKYKEDIAKIEQKPVTENWSNEKRPDSPENLAKRFPEKNNGKIENIDNKIKENALNLLKWKNIKWLTDTLDNWDYSDFKRIKIEDINNSTDIDLLLKEAIWEGSNVNWYEVDKSDYEELSQEVKDSLKHAIKIVKDYPNLKTTFNAWDWGERDLTIWKLIEDKDFKEYISKK